jgi:hypothetical protein
MTDVSLIRIYLLRAMYLLILVGLALMIWPLLLRVPGDLEHMRSVVWSVLTAVSLLAAVGIRYPLKMLPLLFFELLWKTIWILAIGLPQRAAHPLSPGMAETFSSCLVGIVLVLVVMPWRYVWTHYFRLQGDRWK